MTDLGFDAAGDPGAGSSGVPARRAKVPEHLLRIAAQIGVVAVFLGLWQIGSDRWFDSFFFSRPSEVLSTFFEWATDGTITRHASTTLASAAKGFLIGAALALVCGYLLGVSRFWGSVFQPFITALYGVPKVALVPLLIIWFGVGSSLSTAIAAIVVFFLLFFNTFYGIRDVDQSLVDAVRIMGGTRRHLAFGVRFPSALVWIVAGLRLSVPQAFVGVVVAEILASNRGLGYLVKLHAGQFNTTGTFVAILNLVILSFALDQALSLMSRRASIWKGEA